MLSLIPEVLPLIASRFECFFREPAWRVSPRGSLPRNDDWVASTPTVISVLSCSLAFFDLFLLGLRVLGAFALALVGWTSCCEFNPKQSANYLSQCFGRRRSHIPNHLNQRVFVYLQFVLHGATSSIDIRRGNLLHNPALFTIDGFG